MGENGEDPNQTVEIYQDGAGWFTLPPALTAQWPLYAHLLLLQDGRLFYTGGQYNKSYGHPPSLIDIAAGTIEELDGLDMPEQRSQSASVLLPPAQDQRVMIIGGGADSEMAHHTGETTDMTNIASFAPPKPGYGPGPALNFRRMHLNAVLLPDRTILVCGGSSFEESREQAALTAEIFNPAGGGWNPAAMATVPRLHHSIGLLMPDGRVITAGSNPTRGDEELRLEVYDPPYLFRGPRPVIDAAPAALFYGEPFTITTMQANDIQWISLIRAGSTTHSINSDQRLVDVEFVVTGPDTIEAKLTDEPNLAPPGWYMLFITDFDGVPSVATWARVGPR